MVTTTLISAALAAQNSGCSGNPHDDRESGNPHDFKSGSNGNYTEKPLFD